MFFSRCYLIYSSFKENDKCCFLSVVIVQFQGLAPWKVIEDKSSNIISVNEKLNLLLVVS